MSYKQVADVELDSKDSRAHVTYAIAEVTDPDTIREMKHKWEGDDEVFEWDYVMVFKVGARKNNQDKLFKEITALEIDKLRRADLKIWLYKSVQDDEIYCLIGATEKRLRREADRLDYEVPLDNAQVISVGKQLGVRLAGAIDSQDELNRLVSSKDWRQMHGKYNTWNPEKPWTQSLYQRPEQKDPRHRDTLFRSTDRLRLLFGIFQEDSLLGGASIKLHTSLRDPNHPLKACFPLHDHAALKKLEASWAKSWYPLFEQPLKDVRDYFGEKIAFYFAFLQYYCMWLIIPSIVGVLIWLWQVSLEPHPRVDIPILPFLGILVSVWATLFLEFWKRRESTLRADWGMTNFVLKEPPRPEFEGDRVRSPVDGSLIKDFPLHQRIFKIFLSQTVIWSFILMVLGLVVSIFFLRKLLVEWSPSLGMVLTSVVNAVQIQVLNAVYGYMAYKLNDWENHRTQSAWENALIAKTFIFKFINSYNSMFFIAFGKQYDTTTGGCPDGDYCLKELSIQLMIIFGLAIVVNNGIELLLPVIMNRIRSDQNRAVSAVGEDGKPIAEKEKSQPEKEFELEVYTTLADFDEIVVQFGYVSLFVVAFPLSPGLALLNNYVEIRLDAHKLCTLCQRPSPAGAATIGTWHDILTIVSFIAVLVNTLIATFYTKIIDDFTRGMVDERFPGATDPILVGLNLQHQGDYSKVYKVFIFVIVERLITLAKFVIAYAVDDIPEEIQMHIEREKYLVDVLINGVAEESEEVQRRKSVGRDYLTSFDYAKIQGTFPFDHPASNPELVGKPVETPDWFGEKGGASSESAEAS